MNYCGNCGAQVEDDQKFCPKCGAPLVSEESQNTPEDAASNTPQETSTNVPQNTPPAPPAVQNQPYINPPAANIPNPGFSGAQGFNNASRLDKMSLLTVILLNFVTCGIYGFYYMSRLEKEVSIMLGRHTTSSGGMVVLFSLLSCGIYAIWFFNRMAAALDEAMDNRHMMGEHIGSGAGFVIMLLIPLVNLVALNNIISAHNSIIDFDRYELMANQNK